MVVSSDEDDGSWQVMSTTEDDTEEMVTCIKTIKTTRKGTTETVKTMEPSKMQSALHDPLANHNPIPASLPLSLQYATHLRLKLLSFPTLQMSHTQPPHPRGSTLLLLGKRKDAALQVLEISGAVYYKCKTFQQALADYMATYDKGELRAIPTPSGPFWPTAPRTPSPVLSEGEQSYWAAVDDLSDVFSQVQLNPAETRWVFHPSIKVVY
ncbi:hypothetical protein PISMIDRAFT_8682 [Pisolithus microcarpus 441]|uniref:Uncharacterized protein n=1 Tax=Pisolithus microcarpus 441 TaxID=765257 RepID=A0A0C9ZLZ6_9AGAM|nr:hypothetical protein PISMIDRAFT_8682 [Pisolithus microcarpus 441]